MQNRFTVHTALTSSRILHLSLLLGAASALPATLHAATLCVDKSGAAGCYGTISQAVAASANGDTIQVHPGTYHEDVVITSSLSLVGQNRRTTIIDATGLSNGIFVNGFDHPALNFASLDEVTISGFTVRNANYEGILAANVAHATIFGNNVVGNDQLAGSSCAGLPVFETAETLDCGGGIHLIGAVHSSVTQNVVQSNAGGILVSDDTATTHDTVISNNLVENNKAAAGITLASYPAYFAPDEPGRGTKAGSFGTYDVLVTQNLLSGDGEGVLLVASAPGSRTFANQVSGNRVIANLGSGIVIHTGDPAAVPGGRNPDASRNTLAGNFVAGNGRGSGVAGSRPVPDALGTAAQAGIFVGGGSPVIDTLVTGNVIEDGATDVAFSSASTLDMHLNDLLGRKTGVANLNPVGQVNATENFWGCLSGPGTHGCTSVLGGTTVTSSPFLGRAVDVTGGHCMDPIFDLLRSLLNFSEGEDGGRAAFGEFGDRF